MLQINCAGTPYEIGQQHGAEAATQVSGSIHFYEIFFRKQTKLSWLEVQGEAVKFLPYLESAWPRYVEEMKGLANGANVPFESILALNVRTEIAFGMLSDGCTAFAWKTNDASFIAQNWDWEHEQAQNLVCLHIRCPDRPTIHMMTEAGIIGKIGLNSAGVGVTLNAIQAKGVSFDKLPTHLALRTVLDSTSRESARQTLLHSGVAAACHITVSDSTTGAVGLECSAEDIVELNMEDGVCTHSNHFVRPHSIQGLNLLKDSPFRLQRIQELLRTIGPSPSVTHLAALLKDEKNYPTAICRSQTEKSSMETLFSVVMDLKQKYARVKIGKPTQDGEELELRP